MNDASGKIKKRVVLIWYIGLDKQKISYPDHTSTMLFNDNGIKYHLRIMNIVTKMRWLSLGNFYSIVYSIWRFLGIIADRAILHTA